MARKLDRVIVNSNWHSYFAQSNVEFLAPEVSDHCPAYIGLQQEIPSPPKPFKFFNYWAKHEGFLELVKHSWLLPATGNPMNKLHGKLKRLKVELKIFNQTQYGGITGKVNEKRKELANVQATLLNGNGIHGLVEMERKLSLELNDLLIAEKSFFKQKSCISWITEGDQNTKFFQKSVDVRQNSNTIKSLTNAAGVKLTSLPQISEEAISFFQNLLGTEDTHVVGCPRHLLEEILDGTLLSNEALHLSRPIIAEEIKDAMFGIGNDKAPGPDGYSSYFFKVAWNIVGEDVVAAIIHFFQTGYCFQLLIPPLSLLCQRNKIQTVLEIFDPFRVAQSFTNVSLKLLLIGLSNICQSLLAIIKVHSLLGGALQIMYY